jgi:hypothetical protein
MKITLFLVILVSIISLYSIVLGFEYENMKAVLYGVIWYSVSLVISLLFGNKL